jgi:hypothetical protein
MTTASPSRANTPEDRQAMNLADFYFERAPDYKGRTLQAIWSWGDDTLESVHDFIQVLFPLAEPSRFSARAPILDPATIAAFRANATLRANLLKSLDRMLRFYGLTRVATTIVRGSNFRERASWVNYGDHNHLRITRILKCLRCCGLEEYARAFLAALLDVVADYPREIGSETVRFWTSAVAE